VISKTQQYLCMFCLVGSATTVSGIQLDRSAETLTTTPTKTECFLEPCALTAQPSDLDVDQPYRVGAIRG